MAKLGFESQSAWINTCKGLRTVLGSVNMESTISTLAIIIINDYFSA